jgi:antitoxin component YwqK of YwqJK toxin-antitoxin module
LSANKFLYHALIIALLVSASACSKKLMTVLVEDPSGNVELFYEGTQKPENLVKEIRYYSEGDTLSVTPMKKGAINGVVSFYYPNNQIKEQTTFDNGTQDGLFKRYDKEGILVFEGQLTNGLKEGVWTTWYDEVQMEEQRTYQNDVPEGKWTYWYIDGNVKREETYKLGKLIEEKDFN